MAHKLCTQGRAQIALFSNDAPILQVNAGIPLDSAMLQAGLLMNLANNLARIISATPEEELQVSNLGFTIELLSNIASHILSDLEIPARQLCTAQGVQP